MSSNADHTPKVLVMMASYNGEAFIEQQIRSVLAQEGVDVTLVIADDGSTDGTAAICERIAAEDPRVRFERNPVNLGCAKNFMNTLITADKDAFDYFAFCDQDDYWLPEKLREGIEQLEGIDGPALYFTNLENVDIDLQNGVFALDADYEHYGDKELGLIANSASGCTQVFNRELAKLASRELDEYPRYHDSWVLGVALYCGTVVPDMGRSFIKRRLNGGNLCGVPENDLRGKWRVRLQTFTKDRNSHSKLAAQLLDEVGPLMSDDDRAALSKLAASPHSLRARMSILPDKRFHAYGTRGTLFFKTRALLGVA